MNQPASQPSTDRVWTLADAQDWLLSLEIFGMTFGLERVRRLMTALGSPQERLRAVHVVGSNGKSSTVRMIAAILRRHGLRSGAYLSPHLVSFNERLRVDGCDVDEAQFAQAVRRAARAAAAVNRTLPDGENVTQFEALTAAAYSELDRREVDVAVIEAGLGGRFDATNVLRSEVAVLTNVSLEHTRWLGPTIADIAREKVDVVRERSTLVIGPDLHPDALAVAQEVCAQRDVRLITTSFDGVPTIPGAAPYQRRNLAVARAAAQALLGELDDAALAVAAAETSVPGRFETISREPLTILDGAHNADGARHLAEALEGVADGRPIVFCLSILEDKDAATMLREIAPLSTGLVLTAASTPRALSPGTLASLARQVGWDGEPQVVPEPHAALAAARAAAGPGGIVVVAGSLYLLADLLRPAGSGRGSVL
ncbi:unannotated protein [freshwater metagenome]|uniref:Unannotated protein n=1 Tax=freshwater metagenome TaxID=449393 RepID=A0A6J7E9F9_9ZZZZ|nr:bifunctional folylpolyglutamate synthase/dihydrofolate synthase [Actinomycetota bacterium]